MLLVLLSASAVFGQGKQKIVRLDGSTISPTQVDATVGRLMKAAKVMGTGIALFNYGKPVYVKAYGFRDTGKKFPLTPDSVMTAASLSKSAFAYTVMQLVQERKLDLDKPIYRYLPKPLPEYPKYADLAGDERYKKITARMLLSHTSGFPNWRRFNEDGKLHIHFEPGTRYAYSGEGIALLQFVVENITHQSLQTLIKERVFQPLAMNRTSMVSEARFQNDIANGYDESGQSLGPEKRTLVDAAGSMQTTLADYARFVSALMQCRGLQPKICAEMLSPQIRIHTKHQFPSLNNEVTNANDSIRLSYGLGIGLYWTPYGKAFFKEGHDPKGWQHYFVAFANGTGLLIMTNSLNGEGMFKYLLEALLHNSYTPIEWEEFTPYDQKPQALLSPRPNNQNKAQASYRVLKTCLEIGG